MVQPVTTENIEAHIQGEISGQVAVGSDIRQENYVLRIGSIHGGVVNIAPPEKQAVPRLRPTPVLLRPRPFAGLLDRETEVNTATAAFQSAQPVEFYGQEGLGKTVLLRHLSHHAPTGPFPDGVVYLSVRQQAAGDLLQFLFDAFYQCDIPFKPTDAQARHALQNTRALILLDDVELARDEVERLMNAAPSCAFLLASSDRRLWGEGRAVALPGLPLDAALTLLEQELGRALTPEERPAARALCTAVDGHPLRLLQIAAMVREEGQEIPALVQRVQSTADSRAMMAQVVESRPEPERRMLAALAAFGGAPVRAEHLSALTELPNAQSILETLRQRGFVEADNSHYRLTRALVDVLRQTGDITTWTERALTYFTTQAEQHRNAPHRLLEETDAVVQILKRAVETGRSSAVLRLGQIVESSLVISGRWDAWAQVVQWNLESARALGDGAAEARALHQWGTRALCLEDTTVARDTLAQALQLRESLGDRMGAAVTRHNLSLLAPPPPPPPDSQTSSTLSQTTPGIPLVIKGVAGLVIAALVALAGLGVWHILDRKRQPEPLPPNQQQPTLAGQLRISPGELDFGATEVGTAKERSLEIANPGNGPLNGSVRLTTGFSRVEAAAFAIVSGGGDFTLEPGGSKTVTIAFKPPHPSDFEDDLIITSSDAGQREVSVRLSGTGTRAPPPPLEVRLVSVTLNPPTVSGGERSRGTVTLSDAAPDSGVAVMLSSSNPDVVEVPPNVTVRAGATEATFPINTAPVSDVTEVVIHASFNEAVREAAFIVRARSSPSRLTALVLDPPSVVVGERSTGIVTLSEPAAETVVVALSSANPRLVKLPPSVRIRAGEPEARFQIETQRVRLREPVSVVITGSLRDAEQSATLTVQTAERPSPPPDPAAERIDFTIKQRSHFQGRVQILGVVKNVGQGAYESRPRLQEVRLYEGDRLVKRQPFQNLAPGQEVKVEYERSWNASSPSEGEFPPTYRLVIHYDRRIGLDGNPMNDDSNLDNNQKERSGAEINELFRRVR